MATCPRIGALEFYLYIYLYTIQWSAPCTVNSSFLCISNIRSHICKKDRHEQEHFIDTYHEICFITKPKKTWCETHRVKRVKQVPFDQVTFTHRYRQSNDVDGFSITKYTRRFAKQVILEHKNPETEHTMRLIFASIYLQTILLT